MSRGQFDQLRSLRGSLLLGAPEAVAEKLLLHHELFGNTRYLLQFSVGTMPHAEVMRSIELFGTEVAPLVRTELART